MARASLNAQFILTRTRLNKEIIELSETVLQVPHSPVAPPTGHRRSGRTSSLHRAQYCVDPISNVLISGVFGAILRDLKCPDQSLDGQGILECSIHFDKDAFAFKDLLPGNMGGETSNIIISAANVSLLRWAGSLSLRLDNIALRLAISIAFPTSLVALNVLPDPDRRNDLLQTLQRRGIYTATDSRLTAQIPYTLPVGLGSRFYQLKQQSARNELIEEFRSWAQQHHGHIAETRYQLMSDGWSIIGVLGKGCMRRRCRMQGNLGAQRQVYHYESLSCGVSRPRVIESSHILDQYLCV